MIAPVTQFTGDRQIEERSSDDVGIPLPRIIVRIGR
jgi:hypothetical protein